MDWEKNAQEIKERILSGRITERDVELALDIYENARHIWDKYVWLRALGGWVAAVDRDTVEFLRGELEAEETSREVKIKVPKEYKEFME